MHSTRMTAADIPDPPGRLMGPVMLRGGLFDGELKRALITSATLTITRSFKKDNECVSGVYSDSGDVIYEAGERIRIFELRRATCWTQEEPVD